MPTSRQLAALLASLAMVAAFVVLALQSTDIGVERHNRVATELRRLKEVDADWNLQVMRSSLGLNANYDAVALVRPEIETLIRTIETDMTQAGVAREPAHSRLAEDLARLRTEQSGKSQRIEQFKAQNAIYRNSLRYIPTAAEQIDTGLAAQLSRDARAAGLLTDERTDIAGVLRDVLNYTQTFDPAMIENAQAAMVRIRDGAADLPDELRDAIALYLNHVSIVITKLDVFRRLLTEIENAGMTSALDKLEDDWADIQKIAIGVQNRHRAWLLAYSTLLVALLAVMAWRLRRNYRLLVASNARLTQSMRDLQSAQGRLVQSEKMSALGQMVAGIAHEINTPLAYVRGTLEYIGERIASLGKTGLLSVKLARYAASDPSGSAATRELSARILPMFERDRSEKSYEEVASFVADGLHGIDQIHEIVVSLKNFSRADARFATGVDLREGLNSTLVIAKNVLKRKVSIEKEYADIPPIACAPSQINQVFLNIITNASQAIEDTGTIRLATARHDAGHVRVEISDNGRGIPAHIMPKIFDPFFTTKPIGEGTGLGLSICYRIVEEHGGRILVDSRERQGTKFTIILPIEQRRASANGERALAAAAGS